MKATKEFFKKLREEIQKGTIDSEAEVSKPSNEQKKSQYSIIMPKDSVRQVIQETPKVTETDSVTIGLTARKCVALFLEFGLGNKISQKEANVLLACLTDMHPTSFHIYWSEKSNAMTDAKDWAKRLRESKKAKK